MHAESLQHFSGSSEADRLALLPNGKRRQINRYDSILTEWQSVVRVTSDLQNEVAVSALVQHFVPRWLATGSPHRTNGLETESHVLFSFLTLQPHTAATFGLAQFLFRNHEFPRNPF